MIIKLDNHSIYSTNNKSELPKNIIPIIFIHGFTGSSQDWKDVIINIDKRFEPIAIDLFGHGQSDSPNEIKYYTTEGINEQIKKIFQHYNISQAVVCGYSMGGRAALSFALNNPQLINALILESSTAGISGFGERERRRKDDLNLANKIIEKGVEPFIDFWLQLPIFSSQKFLPKEKLSELKAQKLFNSKIGLSNSLTGFSTGSMPNYWDQIELLKMPVKLLVGERDTKYVKINKKLNELIENSSLSIIANSGHNTHLEKPTEFVSLINHFIGNLFK